MTEGASIADGTAVIFDRAEDTWAVGVITSVDGKAAAHPMAEHLERDVVVDLHRDAAIALRPLQPQLPERAPHEPFGPSVEVQSGTIIAQRTIEDPRRYRLFEVVEDLVRSFGDPDSEQPLRVRRYEPETGAVGDVLDLPRGRNNAIGALAGLAEIHYSIVPDRFLKVWQIPIITEWAVDGVASTATFPTKSMLGTAAVRFREGKVTATIASPERLLLAGEQTPVSWSDVYAKLHDGTLAATAADTPTWNANRIRYAGSADSVFTFHVPELTVTFEAGDVIATRETFRGLTLKGFSHRIILEYPDAWDLVMARDTYAVSFFAREGRIVQSAPDHVSVMHDGPPLVQEEIGLVQSLLQYLCGNRGDHVSTETFGETGRLAFDYHERGGATHRGVAPVRIDHWSKTPELVARDFDLMLTRMRALRSKSPRKFDAAFHHYFEGVTSSYPVTRILMLAVAIDTLVALEIGNRQQVKILKDTDTFDRVIAPALTALEESLKHENVCDSAASKIRNNLAGLNHASAGQRQREFWAERGIALTSEERKALQKRHVVVHEGHVGSESTSKALWDNYRRSSVLANLFNRAMLTLLGWSGPYLDATKFDEPRELPLADGAPPPDQV